MALQPFLKGYLPVSGGWSTCEFSSGLERLVAIYRVLQISLVLVPG